MVTTAEKRMRKAAVRIVRLLVIWLPPRRRGMRLARIVERWVGLPSTPLDARHVSGYVVRCDLRDAVQRSIYYTGTFEPKTTRLVCKALRAGDVFLDVGANVGHYTLIAASVIGPNGRIHAIEASPSTAERLQETIRRNQLGSKVSVHVVAAADRRYEATVYAAEDDASIGMRHIRPGQTEGALERVEAVPLDEVLADIRPNVVKVDVEGADLRALIGMRRILLAARPRLVIAETQDNLLRAFGDSTKNTDAFMEGLGYMAEAIDEPWQAPSRAYRLRGQSN